MPFNNGYENPKYSIHVKTVAILVKGTRRANIYWFTFLSETLKTNSFDAYFFIEVG